MVAARPFSAEPSVPLRKEEISVARGAEQGPLSPPAGIAFRHLSETRALDWPRISSHLSRHGLTLDLAFAPRQFAGGLANLNFLVRLNDDWAVLRRPPDGPLPPGANDMAREHRILSNLWRELPLAPRSLHLCSDASIAGVPFQLLAFRNGIVLRGDSMEPFPATKETGAELSHMLIETLAAIHAVDCEKVGLGDLGRPEGFFARTAAGWLGRAERVVGGNLSSAANALSQWLSATQVPDAVAPTLLHNDFKLDNVLLDRNSRVPVAVVDWDMGTRGDPLFDLATLLSYWTEPSDPSCMHELAQMPTAQAGFLSRASAAEAYSRATGRSMAHLKAYRVLTMLKLGVVFHQLHARYRDGETTDARYASFGNLAESLFDFTLDIVNEKAF